MEHLVPGNDGAVELGRADLVGRLDAALDVLNLRGVLGDEQADGILVVHLVLLEHMDEGKAYVLNNDLCRITFHFDIDY